jgi:hypothetical protein
MTEDDKVGVMEVVDFVRGAFGPDDVETKLAEMGVSILQALEDAERDLATAQCQYRPVPPGTPRPFALYRITDVSGVSGEGIVAFGVEFANGRAALQFHVDGKPSNIAVWDSVTDLLEVHGHDGATEIVWLAEG